MMELPECYRTLAIHGFVEEMVVKDDPEYQVSAVYMVRKPIASSVARHIPLIAAGVLFLMHFLFP